MSEQEKTFNCRVCDRLVPKETGLCPHCGFQHAKNFTIKLIAILAVVIFGLSFVIYNSVISSDVEIFVDDTLGMSHQEKAFVTILTQYRNEDIKARERNQYVDAITLRAQRVQDLRALKLDAQVSDWVGRIGLIKHTHQGNICLRINLSPFVSLETVRDEIENTKYDTLIMPDNPLFETISKLKHGDVVIFSGKFFPADNDVFMQTSKSVDTIIKLPTFVFKFEKVRK